MKILEIIPQLSSGGAERFAVDLSNELVCMGHEVVLVVLHKLEGNSFYLRDVDKRVRVVSMNKRMGADLTLPVRILKFIRQESPDVVHTHLRAIVYDALTAYTLSGVMHCHTVHNAASQEAGGGISAQVRKYLFKHSKIIPVTISEESLRSFKDYYGYSAPIINNGRNVAQDLTVSREVNREIELYKKTSETRVMVCLARITKVKRQTMLARITKQLEDHYDFTVLLVGTDKDKVLVEEIRQVGCRCLHILGERHNPLEYLKAADAYCLCSSYEGAPISLIEALGTGCVPICSPVGSIVNIVRDGENGLLAADLSEEAYKKKLIQFLDMPDEKLQELSVNALESYSPYSMATCAEKYVELFKSTYQR